jgi:hypothetical protein
MRRFLMFLTLVLMAGTSWAQLPGDAPQRRESFDEIRTAARQLDRGRPDDWRYKYHNGRWWYYQPSNSWVIWNGNTWIPHSQFREYRTGYRGYYRGPGYDGRYYNRGYDGRYYDDGYYRGRGYRGGYYDPRYGDGYQGYYSPEAAAGANIGGAIGGREGAGIGAAIGGAIGDR